MDSPLKKEFDFYLAHQDELLKQYNGKFVVIRDEKVVGVFDSEKQAIADTQKEYPLGTFLVQLVAPGTDAYTQTYNSRVEFA